MPPLPPCCRVQPTGIQVAPARHDPRASPKLVNHGMSVLGKTLLAEMGNDSGWYGEHYTPAPMSRARDQG